MIQTKEEFLNFLESKTDELINDGQSINDWMHQNLDYLGPGAKEAVDLFDKRLSDDEIGALATGIIIGLIIATDDQESNDAT